MNYWIFQAKPERFDMSKESSLRPGSRDSWLATRYRTEMRPGDIVYFWQAGDKVTRGIYGWGRIESEPYQRRDTYYVDVQYEGKLSEHINTRIIEEHTILTNLMILRLAIGTNFLISRREGEAIAHLMPKHNRPEVRHA